VTGPAYIETHEKGLLREKAEAARALLAPCVLCPRQCEKDRPAGELGECRTGEKAVVSSFHPHFGEEAPLVGRRGSGTIFFTHCNLLCLFCQNFDISHQGRGEPVGDRELARMMLRLQAEGCHNINFVTPSHVVPQILSALPLAIEDGLSVPLVYNSGGYDRVETLQLLEGVFDIYMPDFKFWRPEASRAACRAEDYPEVARAALGEMHRQVGDLELDESGLALRGLLIRHLVLPGGMASTREVMRFIARELSPNTYVNIMPQYRPCGRADEVPGLAGGLSVEDYEQALAAAQEEGVTRLDSRRRVLLFFR
jgi:putative pyruvate formate lyase activating enzyme